MVTGLEITQPDSRVTQAPSSGCKDTHIRHTKKRSGLSPKAQEHRDKTQMAPTFREAKEPEGTTDWSSEKNPGSEGI